VVHTLKNLTRGYRRNKRCIDAETSVAFLKGKKCFVMQWKLSRKVPLPERTWYKGHSVKTIYCTVGLCQQFRYLFVFVISCNSCGLYEEITCQRFSSQLNILKLNSYQQPCWYRIAASLMGNISATKVSLTEKLCVKDKILHQFCSWAEKKWCAQRN
jgi:hypothetical protein